MDEDEITETTGLSKTHLLIGGAAATILLVALVITLARKRASTPTSSSVDPNLVPGDWETSIRHIGHAWDTRWQLQNDKIHDMSQRIDQLLNAMVQLQAAPAVVTKNGNAPANGAATSLPADGIVTPMAVPAPDMQAGGSLPSPPGPASVSM